MKQKLGLVFGVAAIIGLTYGAMNLRADDGHRVWMCHVTGNGGAHLIHIDEHAVNAHLSHGDCKIDPAPGSKAGEPCDAAAPPPPPPPPPPPTTPPPPPPPPTTPPPPPVLK